MNFVANPLKLKNLFGYLILQTISLHQIQTVTNQILFRFTQTCVISISTYLRNFFLLFLLFIRQPQYCFSFKLCTIIYLTQKLLQKRMSKIRSNEQCFIVYYGAIFQIVLGAAALRYKVILTIISFAMGCIQTIVHRFQEQYCAISIASNLIIALIILSISHKHNQLEVYQLPSNINNRVNQKAKQSLGFNQSYLKFLKCKLRKISEKCSLQVWQGYNQSCLKPHRKKEIFRRKIRSLFSNYQQILLTLLYGNKCCGILMIFIWLKILRLKRAFFTSLTLSSENPDFSIYLAHIMCNFSSIETVFNVKIVFIENINKISNSAWQIDYHFPKTAFLSSIYLNINQLALQYQPLQQ